MPDKKIKLPAKPAQCADLLYQTRQNRLVLQKEVERMASLENALKEYFINNLPKSQATGIAGKLARVQTSNKPVPQVEDWPKFYAHIKKTGEWELLQRRINDSAVKERWEADKQVPGVGRFNVVTVSCTALKG